MNIPSIKQAAALCAFTIALSSHVQAAPAVAASKAQLGEKEKIVQNWHNYFAALHSLDYQWTMKDDFTTAPEVPQLYKYKLLWTPKQWRIDTRFVSGESDPKNWKTSIHWFDGQLHNDLSVMGSGFAKLDVSPPSDKLRSIYGATWPLLGAFTFVWEKGDSYKLETLQDENIWQRLKQRISSITPGQWQGQKGRWLEIESGREGGSAIQVFVDEANHFPMYIASTYHRQHEDKSGSIDRAYNFRITRTMKWRSGATTFVFPLDSETREWTKMVEGKTTQRLFTLTSDKASVPAVINAPLAPARFQFDIPAKTLVYYYQNKLKPEDPIDFRYDPKGGSLPMQGQRAQQQLEEKWRRIAAMPKIYDEKADGKLQIAQSLEQAKAGNKRVLLQFGANWCGPCHQLHNLLHQNADIAGTLERGYVVANIDVNEGHNGDLFKLYTDGKGSGIPFMVVLDGEGKVLAKPDSESFNAPDDGYDVSKIATFLTRWMPKNENP